MKAAEAVAFEIVQAIFRHTPLADPAHSPVAAPAPAPATSPFAASPTSGFRLPSWARPSAIHIGDLSEKERQTAVERARQSALDEAEL